MWSARVVYQSGLGTVAETRITTRNARRYNYGVAGTAPDKSPEHVHHRHRVYAMETTGLLIIAVVLLVLTLIRYWSAVSELFR